MKAVRKSYGKKEILKGIDLDVLKGEVLALVGPSGSGKSTLLRCMNRLIEVDSGKIMLKGRDIREIDPVELRRRLVLVPQNSVMFPGTVLENVMIPLRAAGKDDDKAAKRALREAGVPEELFEQDAEKLSGGEKKRVSIARAISLNPEALLMDEPTAGVDPAKVGLIEQNILETVKKRGISVVWVTHDTAQASRVGDRIAAMKDGKIKAIGKRNEFSWEGVY